MDCWMDDPSGFSPMLIFWAKDKEREEEQTKQWISTCEVSSARLWELQASDAFKHLLNYVPRFQYHMDESIHIYTSVDEVGKEVEEKGAETDLKDPKPEVQFWMHQSVHSSYTGPDGNPREFTKAMPALRAVVINHQDTAEWQIQLAWVPSGKFGRSQPVYWQIKGSGTSQLRDVPILWIICMPGVKGWWEIPWEMVIQIAKDKARQVLTGEEHCKTLKEQAREMAKELEDWTADGSPMERKASQLEQTGGVEGELEKSD